MWNPLVKGTTPNICICIVSQKVLELTLFVNVLGVATRPWVTTVILTKSLLCDCEDWKKPNGLHFSSVFHVNRNEHYVHINSFAVHLLDVMNSDVICTTITF